MMTTMMMIIMTKHLPDRDVCIKNTTTSYHNNICKKTHTLLTTFMLIGLDCADKPDGYDGHD